MKRIDNYSQSGVSAGFVMWAGFTAFVFAALVVNAVLWLAGCAELAYWHWPTLAIALVFAGLEAPESLRRQERERAAKNIHPQAAMRPGRHCRSEAIKGEQL